ncbi:hypothetical protein ZWY2020_006619 [Hordeum vulgare]|nr:hypothetical protein ZWY2020_006619 [Hordeum vulgare]
MPPTRPPDARNLFDGMMAASDEDYMQNLIFKGGASVDNPAGYDPNKTQSRDGRGAHLDLIYNYDNVVSRVKRVTDGDEIIAFLETYRKIENCDTQNQLQDDFIEHLWHSMG